MQGPWLGFRLHQPTYSLICGGGGKNKILINYVVSVVVAGCPISIGHQDGLKKLGT